MKARATWLTLALIAACDKSAADQVETYAVSFRGLDEDGDPLGGVQLSTGGTLLGVTSAEGALSVTLHGREGMEVGFDVQCPKGSRAQGPAPTLRLRSLGGPAPELDVACGRDKRTAALIVSAPGFGDLPVLVHDREVARTDASGTAHVLMHGEPHMPLRVVLDTGSRPRVVPASPHKDVQIGARDEIVVFTPELAEPPLPEKKKAVRKAKVQRPPPVYRPEKL